MHSCTNSSNLLLRLTHVPSSLKNREIPALVRYTTTGSGVNRASTLGLVATLFEHGYNSKDDSKTNGARALVSSGLKWYLRCVWYLAHGCELSQAKAWASNGDQVENLNSTNDFVSGMLTIPGLWLDSKVSDDVSQSKKVAQNRARLRALEKIKEQQRKMVEAQLDSWPESEDDEEGSSCIICRLGSADGVLGKLGHVQSSRVSFMKDVRRNSRKMIVVGSTGCILRQNADMESPKVAYLETGSIVHLLEENVHGKRVRVKVDASGIEGYASSSTPGGKPILSFTDEVGTSKWGYNRPVMKLCGHIAHMECVVSMSKFYSACCLPFVTNS